MYFSHEITNSGDMRKYIINFIKNYFLFHKTESTCNSILCKMLTLTERKNPEKLLRLYVIIKSVLQIKLNIKLKSKT